MCGRFTLCLSWGEIHDLLSGFVTELKNSSAPEIVKAPARYNIAPTQPILVLRQAQGRVEPLLMRWGLIPEWVDDPSDFPLIINARAETLKEKTSFKNALKNRRCIIPASGYYEWQRNEDRTKTPTYIAQQSGLPILMAGLYSTWVGPEGEEVDTAAIISVASSTELAQVHHRSPAIIGFSQMADWLDAGSVSAQCAQKLLMTFPEGAVRHHPVSTWVNSIKNDDKNLIVPVFEQTRAAKEKKPATIKPKQLDLF